MRRIISTAAVVLSVMALHAQNPYANYQMTNTHDIFGTSRYVGMGGAMGALGADISVMSNNPAGLALYRRSDISMTMGGQFQEEKPFSGDSRGHFTFDQIGFVTPFSSGFSDHTWVFGINFQKKADYGFSQYCEYDGLNGLSQAAQLAGLYGDFTYPSESLPVRAYDALLYDIPGVGVKSDYSDFNRLTKGNLYGLDFALATSAANNRFYLGLSMGIDFLRYRSNYRYVEYRNGSDNSVQDYDIAANQKVNGTGLNFKIGALVRPIEDSPFRIGFTIETPTWYRLTQEESYYSIASKYEYAGQDASGNHQYNYLTAGNYAIYDSPDENYLDYNVFAPWKLRLAMGSTIDRVFAWDVEYEYGFYDCTKMGYPKEYDDGPSIDMDKDRAMTELTDRTLNGVHNVRVGFEAKPVPEFAIRAGYNYFSKPIKSDARLDQTIDSRAMEFTLGTDYMNLNEAHVFTVGLGYRYKKFYADLAYKYRNQTGNFYAFDDQYQAGGASEAQFMMTTPSSLKPTEVCLDRHNINVTLGFKF